MEELPISSVSIQSKVDSVAFVEFWCGNAKLMANYWCKTMGFRLIGYKGIKSGDSSKTSIAVAQGSTIFVFTSASSPENSQFYQFLAIHGDAIKDIALRVDNVEKVFNYAISHGAISLKSPYSIQDEKGLVTLAQIGTPFGDVVHTLIDISKYSGSFLPGFVLPQDLQKASEEFTGIDKIDHIALAYKKGDSIRAMNWYKECLGFEHFFCNDDDTQEGLSILGMDDVEGGLKTIVVACNPNEFSFKLVLVEAIEGTVKNQVEEFLEFNGGSGVQHVALHANDIFITVEKLKKNGLDFLQVPTSYYNVIFPTSDSYMNDHRLKMEELGLLLDIKQSSEDNIPHYLIQTFTLPLFDRPTFFLEVISRHGSSGFGKKTIKALFEAVENQRRNRDT